MNPAQKAILKVLRAGRAALEHESTRVTELAAARCAHTTRDECPSKGHCPQCDDPSPHPPAMRLTLAVQHLKQATA